MGYGGIDGPQELTVLLGWQARRSYIGLTEGRSSQKRGRVPSRHRAMGFDRGPRKRSGAALLRPSHRLDHPAQRLGNPKPSLAALTRG